MAIRNLYAAETWDAVYRAFTQANFVAYDYDTVKEALIDYLKLYYKESFNDYIESSELIAIIELFAFASEMLAYRADLNAHENFITTAERKASVLKLARLISYTPSRNVPARGLVKITSISTTEQVTDSLGNNLAGATIVWNDPNNPLWKEQFFLVMNRVLTTKFGQPLKIKDLGDTVFQLYSFKNTTDSLRYGVHSYTANTDTQAFQMEIVPADLDDNGPFERAPDSLAPLSILYLDDGLGDGSDLTGFMMYTKQGTLTRYETTMAAQVPNQQLEILLDNTNETDLWVQRVDEKTRIIERWTKAEVVNAENLFFSTDRNRKKYEVETLENERIRIHFGDGNFSDIPTGTFVVWTRQSANDVITVQKNRVIDERMTLSYVSNLNLNESFSVSFSLTSTLQNGAAAETTEHIRQTAPTTYYSQGRMVNGQDYNTFMLRDPSILRLTTVNRTFAGQPKYIDWHDASGNYEDIKLFGDDLTLKYKFTEGSITTPLSTRQLIDNVIEPVLATPGIQNMMLRLYAAKLPQVVVTPRTKFIEDAPLTASVSTPTLNLQEKTRIQGFLDQHWYGEPSSYVDINGTLHAKVTGDTDGKIWQDTIPTTLDGETTLYPFSGSQVVSLQPKFGLRFVPYLARVGNGTISNLVAPTSDDTFTIEASSDPTIFKVAGLRMGTLPAAQVGVSYDYLGLGFKIDQGTTVFAPGDAFVVSVVNGVISEVDFTAATGFAHINLTGEWVNVEGNLLDTNPDHFDPTVPNTPTAGTDTSWVIRVVRNDDDFGNTLSYTIIYRDLKLVVYSPTTKFWYNSTAVIVDQQTKRQVRDKLVILKSNLTADGSKPLGHNESYDVVSDVRDNDGIVDIHSLEVSPSDLTNVSFSGDGIPDNPLQFELFSQARYTYYRVDGSTWEPTQVPPVIFEPGAVTAVDTNTGDVYGRIMGRGLTTSDKLDFMWQHFSPYGNLIDPSPSNIHDAFILTAGYYSSLREWLEGRLHIRPAEPTPLELRNSYGTLLKSKMLSDTVVLHPAKIRLLFGNEAEPQLKAKFRVVRNVAGSLTNDQIRNEILGVINSFFSIENWDFSQTFYATELIALIHQKLPLDISSVVLVPLFANNSFGSLFTIESGRNEIFQSCAKLEDIEVVEYLSSSLLRQGKLS